MAIILRGFKETVIRLAPVLLLFYICISEFHTQFFYWKIFSFNLQFIIIYYWVLRDPSILGYGFVCLAGLVNDVVLSLPLGTSAICYLFVSLVAAYVRNATVRSSLFTDWFTFTVAIIIGNFLYYFLMNNFSNISVKYVFLFYESLFTFILYPVFWFLFEMYKKLMIIKSND